IYETHKNAMYTGFALIVGFSVLAEIILRRSSTRALCTQEVGDPGAVARATAEQRISRLDALHVEVHVVLPRVADAAEDLDAFLREHPLAVAGRGLRHRGRTRPAGIVLGDRQRGEVPEGPGALERDQQIGELVLDRLERTDRHAELLAMLGVLECSVEDRLRGPDHLERDADGGLLDRAS